MRILVNYVNGDGRSKKIVDEVGDVLKFTSALGAAVGLMGFGGEALKAAGNLRTTLSVLALARTGNAWIQGDLLKPGQKRENAQTMLGIPLHMSKVAKFALSWVDNDEAKVLRKLAGKALPILGEASLALSLQKDEIMDEKAYWKLARTSLTLVLLPVSAGWVASSYAEVASSAYMITAAISLREKQLWFQRNPE